MTNLPLQEKVPGDGRYKRLLHQVFTEEKFMKLDGTYFDETCMDAHCQFHIQYMR